MILKNCDTKWERGERRISGSTRKGTETLILLIDSIILKNIWGGPQKKCIIVNTYI